MSPILAHPPIWQSAVDAFFQAGFVPRELTTL